MRAEVSFFEPISPAKSQSLREHLARMHNAEVQVNDRSNQCSSDVVVCILSQLKPSVTRNPEVRVSLLERVRRSIADRLQVSSAKILVRMEGEPVPAE